MSQCSPHLPLPPLLPRPKTPRSPTRSLTRHIGTGTPPGSRTPPRRCASRWCCTSAARSTLDAVPASYPVRVSADNRFILYVNGQRVGDGPARGDLAHWRYERFDLAPLLHAGKNLITATVWNWGVYRADCADERPHGISARERSDRRTTGISTPEGWRGRDRAGPRAARPRHRHASRPTWPPGPAKRSTPRSTTGTGTRPTTPAPPGFRSPRPCATASIRRREQGPLRRRHRRQSWGLVPDALPHMEYTPDERRAKSSAWTSTGAEQPGWNHISRCAGRQFLPAAHVHLLLDRKTLTTAYPILTVSGGKGAKIWLTYSEALYDKDGHKGDRDDVGDRTARGLTRQLSARRRRASHLRAALVAHLALSRSRHRHRQPSRCTLESLTAAFTAYPFEERASFHVRPTRSSPRSGRSAGAPRGSTRMKPTWTRPTTSSSSTSATRASRRSSRTPSPVTTGSRVRRSRPSTTRAFPKASRAAAIPVRCRRPFPPSRCSGSTWCTTTGCTGPIPSRCAPRFPGTRAVLDWFAGYEQPDGLLAQAAVVELHRLGAFGRDSHLRRERRVLRDHARIPGRAQRCRRSRKRLRRSGPCRRATRPAPRMCAAASIDKCWNAAARPAGRHTRPRKSSASRPTFSACSTT